VSALLGPRPPVPAALGGRIRRWMRAALHRDARSARLPIDGLPAGVGELPPGEAALLLCADEASRSTLLRSLLGEALPQRAVTWLCAPGRVPEFAEPEILLAAERRQLRVLSWSEDAALQLRQLGAVHLLRELVTAGMQAQDLLVIDAFEPWLAGIPDDAALEAAVAEATRLLARCSREHQGPILALGPARHRGQSLLPLLARSKMARLAALERDGSAARLDVFRWGSPRSTGGHGAARFAATRFELDCRPDGAWHKRAAAALDAGPALTAADAHTVHAMRGALHDAAATPEHWHVHASLEALLAATTDAMAATVVLAHDQPDDLPALAQAVHRLRSEHPHLLKIVVRETDAAMRRNGELALLRLGANAVMERELGFPLLVQQVEELREQTYGQGPALDATRTLQALAPEPVQGYLPPLAFCALVERMLDRTAAVRPIARDADARLEHSLVYLPLLAHVAHVDALLACNPRRHGDLVTADAHGLYLFLFGCAADDVVPALDALFSLPCSELAHHVRIDPDESSQRDALVQLRLASEHAPVDYSAILLGIGAAKALAPRTAPVLATVQATVLPTRDVEPARGVQAHVLPLRTALA